MSVNVVLMGNGEPVLNSPWEVELYKKCGVYFQVESGGGFPGNLGSYYGNGVAYVTNFRVIFVTRPLGRVFRTFHLPLLNISHEKLSSPFLGSKYVTGVVQPSGPGLCGPGDFKFTFKEGGADDFFTVMKQELENITIAPTMMTTFYTSPLFALPARVLPTISSRGVVLATSGVLAHSHEVTKAPEHPPAYIDPSDPSRVFVIKQN